MEKILFTVCNMCVHLQELRDGFEKESEETGHDRLLVTAAVSAGKETIDAGYEINKISK